MDLLLAHKVIHGDLSAYNILFWDGEIKLIDFPQIVSPEGNRNAYRIFSRDVHRVCEYFSKQGMTINPRKLTDSIWIKHGYPLKHAVDPKFLDPENEDDVKLWKQSRK
jgi:RIO kinase 1